MTYLRSPSSPTRSCLKEAHRVQTAFDGGGWLSRPSGVGVEGSRAINNNLLSIFA